MKGFPDSLLNCNNPCGDWNPGRGVDPKYSHYFALNHDYGRKSNLTWLVSHPTTRCEENHLAHNSGQITITSKPELRHFEKDSLTSDIHTTVGVM